MRARPYDQAVEEKAIEPTRLTGAALARLREVHAAVMRGRHFTLDAASLIREAREERANH